MIVIYKMTVTSVYKNSPPESSFYGRHAGFSFRARADARIFTSPRPGRNNSAEYLRFRKFICACQSN